MMYVVESVNQVLLENGEWSNIGIYPERFLSDWECPPHDFYEAENFQELQNIADKLYGLCNSETFFSHRPKVEIRLDLTCDLGVTERNFKKYAPYVFRTVYKPYRPTMKWLVENLSADDFAQYAKDRNWNNIVISE